MASLRTTSKHRLRQLASSRQCRRVFTVGLSLAGLAVASGFGVAVPASASTHVAGSRAPRLVTIAVKKTTYGRILVEDGFALYRYTKDTNDHSVCTGSCAKSWPPVLESGHGKPLGRGVQGLGTIARADSARQVTFEGIPLYRYAGDTKRGQINGEGLQHAWYVINPASPRSIPRSTGGASGRAGSPTTTTQPTTSSTGGGISY